MDSIKWDFFSEPYFKLDYIHIINEPPVLSTVGCDSPETQTTRIADDFAEEEGVVVLESCN